MIIRCERCSTVYELDDGLLPPEGADVQCARCQHVFRARPPHAAGQALPGLPAAAPPASAAAAPPAPAHSPPAAPTPSHAGAVAASGRSPTVYRPISQPSVPRAPVLRRDTVGRFESRLRWSHRWKWLAPAIVAIAGVAAVSVYFARRAAVDPGAEEARARALALARADDVRSLEEAAAVLEHAIASSPRAHAARADRALVELLLAGALSEPEPRAARREQARALVASATATLDELAGANLARPQVARARAVAAALGGSSAELKRLATAARALLPDDPVIAVAEHSGDVRSTDRSVRERAVSELGMLLARTPELVRARYQLAKGLALAGRRNEALAAVEEVLRRNPRHEGALGLRDAILRPPATAPIAAPGAQGAAVPGADVAAATPEIAARPAAVEKAAALPRKPASTGGEPSRTLPAEPAPSGGGAGAAAGDGTAPPTDAESPPPPRLRPVAVPEPEVVGGGG